MAFASFLLESGIVVLIAVAIPGVVVYLGMQWQRRQRDQSRKPPQSEKLLRPPGYSLAKRCDKAVDAISVWLCTACGFCGLGGFFLNYAWITLNSSQPHPDSIPAGVIGTAMIIVGLLLAVVVVKRVRDVENLRLGLRGEQAVAEALQEVGECGFRSFHDLPAEENWNIDHVAVGPGGVFLIETKARRRIRRAINQPGHVVQVWRNTLRFPSSYDENAIPQTERNAKWLAGYLTNKTGETVEVEALLVLPGWFVENKEQLPGGALVMNANYMKAYLRGRPEKLPVAQMRRIIAALDEKCRDLEF